MEIVGAIVVGRSLDGEWNVASTRRTRAVMCLMSFVVINSMGNIFAAAQEYDARANDGQPIAHDISDASVVSPSLAFACWGFADAQIQVFCYWLMGGLYNSGSDHSRAVGFYKLVQVSFDHFCHDRILVLSLGAHRELCPFFQVVGK